MCFVCPFAFTASLLPSIVLIRPAPSSVHITPSHSCVQDHESINLQWTCHISPSLVSALASGTVNVMRLTVHVKHATSCLLRVK